MSSNPRVTHMLVVDDDPSFLQFLSSAFAGIPGLEITTATNAQMALSLFRQLRPTIVILDLVMPDTSGMDLLDKILAEDPATEVIVITGNYSMDSAVEAIQKGACNYFPKPLKIEKLRAHIDALLEEAAHRRKTFLLDQELMDSFVFEGMVSRSPIMFDLFAKIRRVAPHFRTVLVTGETGTGKELVAHALHKLSPVSSRPLVVRNCSAIVPTLLESELFGYVKGAFTGAGQDKMGVFEAAHGGAVFLDEIGELPLEAQAKLLRVLQNQEVQRVGALVPRSMDVRVIAATNRDLKRMVAEGTFRQDLYYRLSMVELKVPRLAERKEDLVLLQRHFVSKFAAQYGKQISGITRRAQIRLARHLWPGNVRELENVIGNAAMMSTGNLIDLADLPQSVMLANSGSEETGLLTMEQVQNKHLLRVLEAVGGNKARAAEILGISRTTVYEMLAKIQASAGDNSKTLAAATSV